MRGFVQSVAEVQNCKVCMQESPVSMLLKYLALISFSKTWVAGCEGVQSEDTI